MIDSGIFVPLLRRAAFCPRGIPSACQRRHTPRPCSLEVHSAEADVKCTGALGRAGGGSSSEAYGEAPGQPHVTWVGISDCPTWIGLNVRCSGGDIAACFAHLVRCSPCLLLSGPFRDCSGGWAVLLLFALFWCRRGIVCVALVLVVLSGCRLCPFASGICRFDWCWSVLILVGCVGAVWPSVLLVGWAVRVVGLAWRCQFVYRRFCCAQAPRALRAPRLWAFGTDFCFVYAPA